MSKKQSTKISSKLNINLLTDIVWVISFLSVWGTLITLWNSWWAVILVPTFAIMIVGMSEIFHQAVHGVLFSRTKSLNNALGTFSALTLAGMDLKSYQKFHFMHHGNANTIEDPERKLYEFPAYLKAIESWPNISSWKKIILIPKIIQAVGKSVGTVLPSSSPLIAIFHLAIPLIIAIIGFLEGLTWMIPLKIFVSWYLPLLIFAPMDLLIMQSEHYGTERRSGQVLKASEQYKISWNLKLPRLITLMMMGRNMHAQHHKNPGTHWSKTYDHKEERTLPLFLYLRLWWKHGPRSYHRETAIVIDNKERESLN